MNRRDWYERVNAAWPAGPLPALTVGEVVKACRRLFRRLKRATTIRRKWARRVARLERLAQPAPV